MSERAGSRRGNFGRNEWQRGDSGPRRWRVGWVGLTLLGAALLAPAVAGATGLLIETHADEALTSAPLDARFAPIGSFSVTGELTSDEASLVTERYYNSAGAAYGEEMGVATATFYQALTAALSPLEGSLLVNGTPLSYSVLDPDAADSVRFELAARTGDPSPLRELGTPLLQSESWTVDSWSSNSIELSLHSELEAHGTLRGVALPVDWHKAPAGQISVDIEVRTTDRLRALYAPYHTLNVTRHGPQHASATYYGYERCTDFPVTLLLSTGDEPIRLDLLPFRYGEDEMGTLMALLTPDETLDSTQAVPRDIVLAIDHSGSMEGEKIEQARNALNAVIDGLSPADSFSIVSFHQGVSTSTETLVEAAPDAVAHAHGFVDALVADGGTNIYDALETAFAAFPLGTGNPRYIVLLTDGQPTEGIVDVDPILEMARLRNEIGARIFTFGIGHDVNTVLLDQLASESSGDALYIFPGQAIDATVEAFFDSIAAPLLTDPVLDLSAFGGGDLFPTVLNDLYAGQTAIVMGRYAKPGRSTVVLSGSVGDSPVEHRYDVSLPALQTQHGFVPRIWATRQVGDLLQDLKLGKADPQAVSLAHQLARRYGVITEFTYFQIDEHGKAEMIWSDVPSDAVGSTAVETSSSIDGYQKGSDYGASVDSFIHYYWDRTFLAQGEDHLDTSVTVAEIDAAKSWIDVHFGSPTYLQLAREAGERGIGGFLGVDSSVRFEFFGHTFRITDTAGLEPDVIPVETSSLPAWNDVPTPEATSIDFTETVTGTDVAIVSTGQNGVVTLGTDDDSGCSAAPRGAAPIGLGLALALFLGNLRRRRRVEWK